MPKRPAAAPRLTAPQPTTRRSAPPGPARRLRWPALLVAVATAGGAGLAGPARAAGDAGDPAAPGGLARQFAAAATEFGVPQSVLLALAYQESRWESHRGQPSTTGNYGVFGLTDVDVAAENAARATGNAAAGTAPVGAVLGDTARGQSGRGEDRPGGDRPGHPQARPAAPARPPVTDSPALHTLDAAAALIHRPAAQLRADTAQNIRGGAALLARYQQAGGGSTHSTDPGRWYGAVARYGEGGLTGQDATAGRVFADRVFATVRAGAARTTSEGQRITLPARPDLAVDRPSAATPRDAAEQVECPSDLGCDYTPAAYALTDPKDPTSYGNYNPANRPADGQAIRYIVIHDTESDYAGAIASFQNPNEQATAHYLVRSSDGHVTQLVHTKDIAWHAGNKTINMHSVGIEHEGFALPDDRPTWYSEQLYQSSAKLVRYLAARFGVPLDREHIIGHDDVPGPTQADIAGMHWDPGTFWDWAHYLELLGAPIPPGTDAPPQPGDTVTIAPAFDSTNEPPVSGVAARPENFVYLRTGPSTDSPLINNGGTRADDWSDKAVTGATYAVADEQGDWTSIWYDGQKCWFANPGGHAARTNRRAAPKLSPYASVFDELADWAALVGPATPADATDSDEASAGPVLLTPRSGLASIPVYGRAYPEAAAYAPYPAIKAPAVVPVSATIAAGQEYLAAESTPQPGQYFYDENINGDAPNDRTLVVGKDTYYPIRFNHRLAFLNSADVRVVR
ncbi:N-acetylmuramoyl-L-alanine amidase [Kitasatospora sp. NBC_01250]|uniref:N-acetylmuramoyl-L-alanine amidase n=1 Tax=Kitasatospora sp. NBC_01250 TaxID=2903571 RepID=UPI002E333EF3|nr:N-acetylmuramoyl-L-alanine amidase [Kitasatospora sp. NBC_01250]